MIALEETQPVLLVHHFSHRSNESYSAYILLALVVVLLNWKLATVSFSLQSWGMGVGVSQIVLQIDLLPLEFLKTEKEDWFLSNSSSSICDLKCNQITEIRYHGSTPSLWYPSSEARSLNNALPDEFTNLNRDRNSTNKARGNRFSHFFFGTASKLLSSKLEILSSHWFKSYLNTSFRYLKLKSVFCASFQELEQPSLQ